MAGNEALLIKMNVPTQLRETIRYMSDTDIITLLQTHPDLITLEFDEALTTQLLDMIEKGSTSEELHTMMNIWLRDHLPGNPGHTH
ncbi:MAG: hypothetical protein IDH49_08650 [Gammaproteobacteria bacterium]|nr:hypothetical protein [Gammaproteobacteria bacterium]